VLEESFDAKVVHPIVKVEGCRVACTALPFPKNTCSPRIAVEIRGVLLELREVLYRSRASLRSMNPLIENAAQTSKRSSEGT
jgi:hypothetical protein